MSCSTLLGLGDAFEVVHSAQDDEFGKPHPLPYLRTAALLGVEPEACLAIEDSMNGAISARVRRDAGGGGARRRRDRQRPIRFRRSHPRVAHPARWCNVDRSGRRAVAALGVTPSIPPGVPSGRSGRGLAGSTPRSSAHRRDARATSWVDFDLYGHQIVAHLAPPRPAPSTNAVDGHEVPADHSGVLLNPPAWRDLVQRLESHGDRIRWLMKPTTRFAGLAGEQHTCFVADPAGNALEFKAFADDRSRLCPLIDRTNSSEETTMQIGMIGLGRMGANIVRRLDAAGHGVSFSTSTPRRYGSWSTKASPPEPTANRIWPPS